MSTRIVVVGPIINETPTVFNLTEAPGFVATISYEETENSGETSLMSSNNSSFSDSNSIKAGKSSEQRSSKRKYSITSNCPKSQCLEDVATILSMEPPSVMTSNLITTNCEVSKLSPIHPGSLSLNKMHTATGVTSWNSVSNQSSSKSDCSAETDSAVDKLETTSAHNEPRNPHSPKETPKYVKMIIQQWGSSVPLAAIHPDKFLTRILKFRGYSSEFIKNAPKTIPTSRQIEDYDQDIVQAVRDSDLIKVKLLQSAGRSMSACNKFAESIIHMACRRSDVSIVEYLLETGGDCNIVDDYGRNPLHDACWRPEPRFDVVTLLLDRNIDLLLMLDIRGASPLSYVRPEHWLMYCAYFYHQKDKYWREKPPSTTENKLDDTQFNSVESKRLRL